MTSETSPVQLTTLCKALAISTLVLSGVSAIAATDDTEVQSGHATSETFINRSNAIDNCEIVILEGMPSTPCPSHVIAQGHGAMVDEAFPTAVNSQITD